MHAPETHGSLESVGSKIRAQDRSRGGCSRSNASGRMATAKPRRPDDFVRNDGLWTDARTCPATRFYGPRTPGPRDPGYGELRQHFGPPESEPQNNANPSRGEHGTGRYNPPNPNYLTALERMADTPGWRTCQAGPRALALARYGLVVPPLPVLDAAERLAHQCGLGNYARGAAAVALLTLNQTGDCHCPVCKTRGNRTCRYCRGLLRITDAGMNIARIVGVSEPTWRRRYAKPYAILRKVLEHLADEATRTIGHRNPRRKMTNEKGRFCDNGSAESPARVPPLKSRTGTRRARKGTCGSLFSEPRNALKFWPRPFTEGHGHAEIRNRGGKK